MEHAPFVKGPDGFTVPSFRGIGVARVVFDSAVSLHVGSNTVVIDTPFQLFGEGGSTEIRPGDSQCVAPAAGLLNAVVATVRGGLDGRLDVEFADGRALAVRSNGERQAWMVAVGGRDFVTCRYGKILFTGGASAL